MYYTKLLKSLIPLFLVVVLTSLACGSSTSGTTVITPTAGAGDSNSNPTAEAQPTNTVEQKPMGSSRTNPAPFGSEISSDDMLFSIVEVVRPADEIVKKGNMFNSTPDPEKEYIFIKVKITCQKSSDDKCSVTPITFKLVNSSGNIVEPEIVLAGVTDLLESSDLFGGASIEGYLPFIIEKSEVNPVLMYEPLLLGDPFYMQITQE